MPPTAMGEWAGDDGVPSSRVRRASGTILRWTIALTVAGVALGVWLTLARVPFYADSGAKPTDIGSYSFWIAIGGIVGAVAGMVIGVIAALIGAAR